MNEAEDLDQEQDGAGQPMQGRGDKQQEFEIEPGSSVTPSEMRFGGALKPATLPV